MTYLPTRYPPGPLLRDRADLTPDDLSGEDMLHLSQARVVFADYDLIQHDFPDMRDEIYSRSASGSTRNSTSASADFRMKVDDWLLANAALISPTQACQEIVNDPIPVDAVVTRGYRPRHYGRAAVVCAMPHPTIRHSANEPIGLLDLKGVGVGPDKIPLPGPTSNGLLSLQCALREYLMQRVIDEIFKREAPTLWTVPVYAILSLGFGILGSWHGAPAAILVRRAHKRNLGAVTNRLTHEVSLSIERLLRHYGLTSTNPTVRIELLQEHNRIVKRLGGGTFGELAPAEIGLYLALKGSRDRVTIEASGVQTAGDLDTRPPTGMMVDFGAIRAQRHFDRPLALDAHVSLNVSWPHDPDFIQPDPSRALPFSTWSRRALTTHCRSLAEHFVRRSIAASDVRSSIDASIQALLNYWSRQARKPA